MVLYFTDKLGKKRKIGEVETLLAGFELAQQDMATKFVYRPMSLDYTPDEKNIYHFISVQTGIRNGYSLEEE